MASRLIDPSFRAVDDTGAPISGSKLYIFYAGTSTPAVTYSNSSLTSANANPVVSGISGLFPDTFAAPDDYDVIWTDGSGTDLLTDVTLDTWLDMQVSAITGLSGGINANGYTEHLVNAQTGTTYTYLDSDRAKIVTHSNISDITAALPQANLTTFDNGWYTEVMNTGAGLLTITPTISTIGDETNVILTRGQSVSITSDGSNYLAQIKGDAVGSRKRWYSATPPKGWLLENGSTIGKSGSGATFAAAIYRALYIHLWNSISNTYAPVSTGRGASANADFDANKTLTIPSMANASDYGVGTYGAGETAGAATGTPAGTVAATGGTALTINQMPAHTHPGTYYGYSASAPTQPAPVSYGNIIQSSYTCAVPSEGGGQTHSHSSGAFSGASMSLLQPIRGTYSIIKY